MKYIKEEAFSKKRQSGLTRDRLKTGGEAQMKQVRRVLVNSENSSDTFWQGMGGFLWASFAGVEDHSMAPDELELKEEQIDRIKDCPGWDDPEAPKHAPHPLIIE